MPVSVTENAILKIKEVLAGQEMFPESTFVRVGVKGKSCSGVMYAFGLDESKTEQDEVLVQDNITVLYDKKYEQDLNGIVIDYKENEEGQKGFTFKNPLQVLSSEGGCCGGGSCGSGSCGV